MSKISIAVCAALVAAGSGIAAASAQTAATMTLLEVSLYAPRQILAPGDWLYFDLEPAIIKSTYRKKITLANFAVVGDFERLEWRTSSGSPLRSFPRVESKIVDGLTLSVFEVKFPAREVRDLGPFPIRFDAYHASGAPWPFRVRSSILPKAKVVKINDRVQYSSHVVNIVVPIDWNEIVTDGDRLANAHEATRIFLQHFEDAYQDVAFVPTRSHRQPVGAHLAWLLDVEGLNMPTWDARELVGGSSILMGGNVHTRGDFLWNAHAQHETGHQWGFWFDLFELAGSEPMVSSECWPGPGHTPMVAEAFTFLKDSCIPGDPRDQALCVERDGEGGGVLAPCDLPLTYHPLQLYAMGLLEPDEVPPTVLRLRQDMPQPYRAGTRVEGPFVEIPIEDVIARYGEREGPPMPSVWRRAHVVLSPDRLLPPKELAWFNFFAKRVSDPDLTGIEGLDRIPSLEFATGGRVDLQTEIRPLAGAPVEGEFSTSYPRIGKKDVAGVKLDRVLETRFIAGTGMEISGRVLDPGASKKVRIRIGPQKFQARIQAGGRFTVRVKPRVSTRGPRLLSFELVAPGRGLGVVGPVYVE